MSHVARPCSLVLSLRFHGALGFMRIIYGEVRAIPRLYCRRTRPARHCILGATRAIKYTSSFRVPLAFPEMSSSVNLAQTPLWSLIVQNTTCPVMSQSTFVTTSQDLKLRYANSDLKSNV
ncbi:hypothetical protein J6590_068033 [Homalodisca vitripennis]|nr:hypothetical protein J6590_068033 [Homalodisca vitripennis]